MEKLLLRVEEAAEMLSVSRWTIYRWVEEGRLEATKLGRGTLRIFSASILAMVNENRTQDGSRNSISRAIQQPVLRRLS
jgi:excisionase family DNA binding protein